MAYANSTTHLPITKRLYPKDISRPGYQRSAFFGLINKDSKFGGELYHVVVRTGEDTGGGSNFELAYQNLKASVLVRFNVTAKEQFSLFRLTGKVIAETRGNERAIISALKVEVDSARKTFFRGACKNLWGNGGGTLGQISAGQNLALTTLTLRQRTDVINFVEGMSLVFATDDGSAASPAGLLGAPAVLTVVTVNRDAGTVVLSAALNTIGGMTANCFIFKHAGDYAASPTGMRGWHPVAAPTTGDSFFGLDRSTGDVARKSGFRYTGGGATKQETINKMGATAQIYESRPTHIFVNSEDVADFVTELDSKVVYSQSQAKGMADIGYSGIRIHTAAGEMSVVGDADVPRGYLWMCDPSLITLRSMDGEFPTVLNEDGLGDMVRDNSSNSYVGRLGAYYNLTSDEPFHVGIGSF